MSNASSVDSVLFDFGGVIVAINFGCAFDAWARAANVSSAEIAARFSFDPQYQAYERGEIDAAMYFASLRQSLGLQLSDEQFLVGWNSIFLEPLPGIVEVLQSLSCKIPLYLFSNTNAAHHRYWREKYRDLLKPFKTIYCSYEIGFRKPTVDSFFYVLKDIGMPPDRMAFFDDLAENVTAARQVGLQGFQVTSSDDIRQVLSNVIYINFTM